jgi:hypothetical protein
MRNLIDVFFKKQIVLIKIILATSTEKNIFGEILHVHVLCVRTK